MSSCENDHRLLVDPRSVFIIIIIIIIAIIIYKFIGNSTELDSHKVHTKNCRFFFVYHHYETRYCHHICIPHSHTIPKPGNISGITYPCFSIRYLDTQVLVLYTIVMYVDVLKRDAVFEVFYPFSIILG